MKKLLATACAVAALSVAAPVSAQSGILGDLIGGIFGGSSSRLGNYGEQIRIAYQRGEISESESRNLQNQYIELRQLEQQYRQDGLSRDERYELGRRASELQRRFQMARSDGSYGEGDRWEDSDGRRCPPGLAKKRNGCLPPGQVGREDGRYRDTYGYRDGDAYEWRRDRDDGMDQVERRKGRASKVKSKKDK